MAWVRHQTRKEGASAYKAEIVICRVLFARAPVSFGLCFFIFVSIADCASPTVACGGVNEPAPMAWVRHQTRKEGASASKAEIGICRVLFARAPGFGLCFFIFVSIADCASPTVACVECTSQRPWRRGCATLVKKELRPLLAQSAPVQFVCSALNFCGVSRMICEELTKIQKDER